MRLLLLTACIFYFCTAITPVKHTNFNDFRSSFINGYRSLNLPELQLSYAENFQHIQSFAGIQNQLNFFDHVKNSVTIYKNDSLPDEDKNDLALIEYET